MIKVGHARFNCRQAISDLTVAFALISPAYGHVTQLLADRGHDTNAIRTILARHGIVAMILPPAPAERFYLSAVQCVAAASASEIQGVGATTGVAWVIVIASSRATDMQAPSSPLLSSPGAD